MKFQDVMQVPNRKLLIINGKRNLSGASMKGNDSRSTASLIIAGLCAKGESYIYGDELLDSGYVSFDKKLSNLSAKINRV